MFKLTKLVTLAEGAGSQDRYHWRRRRGGPHDALAHL